MKQAQANKYPTGKKLVTFLEEEYGFSFSFEGGKPPEKTHEQLDHLVESVMPEIRFQGANVVATENNHVIIYDHDTLETQSSLRDNNVVVTTFDGHELARWNGGPHCMTCPIERA